MRGAVASGILAVWKRAAPRNRMREIFTSGSVGGLAEQSLVLPGHYLERVAKRGLARSGTRKSNPTFTAKCRFVPVPFVATDPANAARRG